MREGHTKAKHLTFECFPGPPLNHVYRGVNQMAASLLGQLRRFEALLVTTLMPTLSSVSFIITFLINTTNTNTNTTTLANVNALITTVVIIVIIVIIIMGLLNTFGYHFNAHTAAELLG